MESPEDLEIQELLKTANLDMDIIDQEISTLEIEDISPSELNIDKMSDKDVEKLADDYFYSAELHQLNIWVAKDIELCLRNKIELKE